MNQVTFMRGYELGVVQLAFILAPIDFSCTSVLRTGPSSGMSEKGTSGKACEKRLVRASKAIRPLKCKELITIVIERYQQSRPKLSVSNDTYSVLKEPRAR